MNMKSALKKLIFFEGLSEQLTNKKSKDAKSHLI